MKIIGLSQIKKCYPGFEVKDADKPCVLTISPKLAEVANQEDPNSCLVARAFEFKFPFNVVPYVFPSLSYIVNLDDKTITKYEHPDSTKTLIRAYDGEDGQESRVIPGEYVLKPPCPSHKTKRNGKVTQGTGKTGKTRQEANRLFNRRVADSEPFQGEVK